jgi:hypothetical protein
LPASPGSTKIKEYFTGLERAFCERPCERVLHQLRYNKRFCVDFQ